MSGTENIKYLSDVNNLSDLVIGETYRTKGNIYANKKQIMKDKTETMTEQEFEQIVEEKLNQIKEVLVVKSKEYRRDNNPFHNFEQGARITGLTREKVLDGFLLKHEISINDMTNDLDKGILPKQSTVDEKFGDNLIFLIIKKASITDRINKSEKQVIREK